MHAYVVDKSGEQLPQAPTASKRLAPAAGLSCLSRLIDYDSENNIGACD
jgi:hypothetical protein